MSARLEIEPTQYVVRLYNGHDDNYVASATVRVYGNKAWMSQITGRGAYALVADKVGEILDAVKADTLEGFMTPANARALRMFLRGRMQVDISDYMGYCAGRMMPWVIVRRLDVTHDSTTAGTEGEHRG